MGSINLGAGSSHSRRELAIEVKSLEVLVRALQKVAHHDWKHSHPLDLSDEGLLEELKKHKIDAANELALEGDNRKPRRKK